jgi:hypothetical protein
LLQQRQVGTATGDAFEEIEAAHQGDVRIASGPGGFDQARPDGIEPGTVAGRQLLVTARGTQFGETGNRFPRVTKA